MKLSRSMWIDLSRVAAVMIVAVLVGLSLSCCARDAKPAPVPTTTPAPTATGVGYPTPTATGIGYPTPTATGESQPTATMPPTPITNISVTATPQSTITVGPNTTYFDQTVYNVKKGGETFNVYVMWSGSEDPPCYFWGGQINVFYNASLITLKDKARGVIEGITSDGTFATANATDSGQTYFYLTTDWNEYIYDQNAGNGINGSGYWVKLTFSTNATNTGTSVLGFSDAVQPQARPLEVISQWDNAYASGYTENAMWINSSVNVQ